MLAKAPYRESLRQNHRQRNSARPEKSQSRARCAARTAVCSDPRYSPGAARVYVLMDDWAGLGGRAYPKQDTLARQMGRSRQSIQRYVAELERGGAIVRLEQHGRAVVYVLRWAAHAHQRASQLVNNPVCREPECSPRTEPAPVEASRTGTSEPNEAHEGGEVPERECPNCGGTGEREYAYPPAHYDSRGRFVPEGRRRGICGCRL